MATTPIENLSNLGNIADGDKLVGEKVTGTSGNITIAGILYDADFISNGLMTRTASAVYTNRILTGTTNYIDISNGNGVSGNPTITISSTYAGGTSISSLGTVTGGVWNASLIPLAYGGTNKNMTPSNGGVVYTDADSMEVLSGTVTANKMLLSQSSSAPIWSTSTIPSNAGTGGKILISDGTNYILSNASYPDTAGAAGTRIKSNGSSWVVSNTTFPDTGTLNKIIIGNGTNYIESTPAFPNISATIRKHIVSDGTDWVASTETYAVPGTSGKVMQSDGTNWTSVTPTGTGIPVSTTSPTIITPNIVGTATNNNAAAGSVGEVISSAVSAVAITTNTLTNVTSISLTAGDWDVFGGTLTNPAGTSTQGILKVGINTTSATLPTDVYSITDYTSASAGVPQGMGAPTIRLNLSGTTTVYLVSQITYAISTLTINGTITARRAR